MRMLFFYLIFLTFATQAQTETFFGEPVPMTEARLFSATTISSTLYERDFAISPDGTEVYYSLVASNTLARIVYRKFANGQWSLPKALPFSTNTYDIEPALSPDGKKLFFASSREGNFDIYISTRSDAGVWSAPVNVGSPVNTPANEYYPSVTEDGTLYWTARYTNGAIGGEDIWYAKWNGTGYTTPAVISTAVNSDKDEYNAFVDPKGRYILFGSYGRPDDSGRGDIYMSTKGTNGNWQGAVRLEQNINSPQLDYCPYVSADGKYLFFTSERAVALPRPTNPFNTMEILRGASTPAGGGNIYWVKFE